MARTMFRVIVGVFASGLLSLSASRAAQTEDCVAASGRGTHHDRHDRRPLAGEGERGVPPAAGFLSRLDAAEQRRCGHSKASRSATERSSSTSIRSGGAHLESPFVSKTTITSSSCTSGLIRTVRPSGPACSTRPQTHGVLLWDFFPQYENRAPLRENGWNHIKMVVSGRRMNVFVNDATSPTLEVGRLEGMR